MLQNTMMYTTHWRHLQVQLRSSGKWLPRTPLTACSEQQALLPKNAIISRNSPDTIAHLWTPCPECFRSTAVQGLLDEVRLENIGLSKVRELSLLDAGTPGFEECEVSQVALCCQENKTILAYFHRCCDKMSWEKQLKGERAYSDSQLEEQSIVAGKLRQWKSEAADHNTFIIRREGANKQTKKQLAATWLPSSQLASGTTHSGYDFPSQGTYSASHRHAHIGTHQMILGLVKWTVDTNHCTHRGSKEMLSAASC